ncbi:MAG: hypothetical protein NZO16_03165, partial [Deltaproteobacteria bacterium]|nr:hypothetical protein [Deltaproteobacteria bacterium]
MENRRFLLALVLSFIFVYFYMGWVTSKYSTKNAQEKTSTATPAGDNINSLEFSKRNQTETDEIFIHSASFINSNDLVQFENNFIRGAISSAGAVLTDLTLKVFAKSLD